MAPRSSMFPTSRRSGPHWSEIAGLADRAQPLSVLAGLDGER